MSRRSRTSVPPRAELAGHRIGVYAGAGASHSWTWTVDTLEGAGFSRIVFLDENDVVSGRLDGVDVVAFGGGDPVAMAVGMGAAGGARLRRFIEGGGLYLGFCAGAYLVMEMDYAPLEPFTFTGVKAANVVSELPVARSLPSKMATAYGGRFALHPVRERVSFQVDGGDLGPAGYVEAPLYGGPPMLPSGEEAELARFHAFSPDTHYLVDADLATAMLLGRAAVCRRVLGSGALFLCAPHLEHPGYPEANGLLTRIVSNRGRVGDPGAWGRDAGPPFGPVVAGEPTEGFRRHLAEARITALALAAHPVTWLLGHKHYDPEKIAVLLEAAWRRVGARGRAYAFRSSEEPGLLEEDMREVLSLIRAIKSELSAAAEGTVTGPSEGGPSRPGAGRDQAACLFPLLNRVVSRLLEAYFAGAWMEMRRAAVS